ncbi:COP9 signalosome complex subunit 8 [Trichuris trichiura]|uniref:COP9 signalosome complex subunit 8 n=1 Tax=Trichuris trichiura TaxID=36087 RepID=A0A077Z7K7_TRITR|nr:COP9 signalosome complex subunit 8 [Trichuris trichiura]
MEEEPMLGGVELLEEKELHGFLSQEEYTELLAAYISQNELQLALFLWRRLPSHLKKESSDLTAIWEVGKSLIRMEYSSALAALNRDWSDKMKPIVETIRTSVNNYVFTAVEKAYSCISVKSLAALLGRLEDEVLQESLKRGWTADNDPSYLKPVQPAVVEDPNKEDDFVKTMIRQTKFFEHTVAE